MFENSSVMVLKANTKEDEVLKIEVDAETQNIIIDSMKKSLDELIEEKTQIIFDGSYKPNEDEILKIENYQLSDEIKDAIRDPLGVTSFKKDNDVFPEIKAIFIGERIEDGETEKFNVVFQRFRKEQYISTRWCNLFFENNTFFQEKRYGISIADGIDCYYTDKGLQFSSFYYARQIFDLSECYRSATDSEVESFAASPKLAFDNSDGFKIMANTWIRRKIAMINDSQVLDNYSAKQIKSNAKLVGINIDVKDKKIVIPNDKEKIKIILGFLDEEAYKGPFSQKIFLANSKQQVNKRIS